jgi:hypothetical protein
MLHVIHIKEKTNKQRGLWENLKAWEKYVKTVIFTKIG